MRFASVLPLVLLLVAGAALASNELIVTEIMYNSTEATDVEWIELYNAAGVTLDLTGWYVLDDNLTHTRVALSGSMAAGEVKVVVGTQSLFTAKYPAVTNYFPVDFQPGWALGNSGDQVNVFNAAEELVSSVTFTDAAPWPTAADGTGPSLVLVTNNCGSFSDATCWTVGVTDGTPGILSQTVADENASWSRVKALFR